MRAGARVTAILGAVSAAAARLAGSTSNRAHRTQSSGFAGAGIMAGVTSQRAISTEAILSPAGEKVKELIKQHEVIVFSKTTCPFCSRAKKVLESEGTTFHVFELDELSSDQTREFQDALEIMTGARTVPRVFVRGECLGGCDDITKMQQKGELAKALGGASKSSGFKIQKSEEEWKAELDKKRYYILRQQGTEAPGSSEFNNFMPTKGHFACAACNLPLYSATSKFRSSCGWPVFDKCYYSQEAGGSHVGTVQEWGGLEIVCNRCASHLGHVFFDAYSTKNPNGERH